MFKVNDSVITPHNETGYVTHVGKIFDLLEVKTRQGIEFYWTSEVRHNRYDCPECDGEGQHYTTQTDVDDFETEPCETCQGDGWVRQDVYLEQTHQSKCVLCGDLEETRDMFETPSGKHVCSGCEEKHQLFTGEEIHE